MSVKREPATEVKRALKSAWVCGGGGVGGVASPAETSRTEKPAAADSATGQRREEPWLRAMRRWVVETRRWARRPEMAASMGRGKRMSAPKRARESG